MSFESRKSRTDSNAESNKQQLAKRLPARSSSPSMFDDTICSGTYSQLIGSNALNLMSQRSVLPSIWTHKTTIPSIGESGCSLPSSQQTEKAFLSISKMERVSLCHTCDDFVRLDESIDFHNRSITTENSMDSVIKYSPKRARLNEPSDMGSTILLNSDILLSLIAGSTNAINDHLVSLQEDCAQHLAMVNSITSPVDK